MEIIAIASAKGGVGKTTVTANLGAALVLEFNKQVVLLDGNVTGANLGLHFGLNYTPFTVADKKVDISQIIYAHQSGVRIVPAPLSNKDIKKVDLRRLKSFINSIGDVHDFVLIDSAPTLGKEALTAIDLCDELLIVTTPDLPAVVSCKKTIDLAHRLRKRIRGIVLNRVRGEKYEMTAREVEAMLNAPISSIIPESEEIQKSITLQHPLVSRKPNHYVSIEFKKLAALIAGEAYEPSNLMYSLRKFFEFILHRKERVGRWAIEPKEKEELVERTWTEKKVFTKKPREKEALIKEIIEEVDVEELEKELKKEIDELKRSIKKQIRFRKLREKYKEE